MTYPTLPMPSLLTSDYVAPAGDWAPPAQANVRGNVHVDLTAARIHGAGTGYLFKPQNDGTRLEVDLGYVADMAGIALGLIGAGNRGEVILNGGILDNVVSGLLYKTNDGGRIDATLDSVTATGLGAGARTFGSIAMLLCNLVGGGNPSSGNPAAAHCLDLNTTGTPVADQTFYARDNTISGFTTSDFQGDIFVLEETVSYGLVVRNALSNVSDAMLDSKARLVVASDNDLTGAAGLRMFAAHFGKLYSVGNRFVVPVGTSALQATAGSGPDATHPIYAGLVSEGDIFSLLDSAAGRIAKAEVTFTGSTGFAGPRAGVIELVGATWNGSQTQPWIAVPGTKDGVTYYPQVIAR